MFNEWVYEPEEEITIEVLLNILFTMEGIHFQFSRYPLDWLGGDTHARRNALMCIRWNLSRIIITLRTRI